MHDDQSRLPALIKAGLLHVQFETIHPFLDGNGRIGRLLVTLYLCMNGVLRKPLLYLSLYLKSHRREYYRLLQEVREHGNWEAWLDFFLTGVADTANQAFEAATQIVDLCPHQRSTPHSPTWSDWASLMKLPAASAAACSAIDGTLRF